MEASEEEIIQERLTDGKTVSWYRWKSGDFWRFAAGPYGIVQWWAVDGGRRVKRYMAAYRGTMLGPVEPLVSLNAAKKIVADHARLMFVRRENAKAMAARAGKGLK